MRCFLDAVAPADRIPANERLSLGVLKSLAYLGLGRPYYRLRLVAPTDLGFSIRTWQLLAKLRPKRSPHCPSSDERGQRESPSSSQVRSPGDRNPRLEPGILERSLSSLLDRLLAGILWLRCALFVTLNAVFGFLYSLGHEPIANAAENGPLAYFSSRSKHWRPSAMATCIRSPIMGI